MKKRNVIIVGTVIVIIIMALVIGIVWAFNQQENVQDGPPQHTETNEQVSADTTGLMLILDFKYL